MKAVKKMILDNRRIAIREIANDIGISFGSCQAIFTDVLGTKCTAAQIVSKLLNFEYKQRSMDIAQEMLTMFNDDPGLLESWVYDYAIETKVQLLEKLLMMLAYRSAHANQFLRMF